MNISSELTILAQKCSWLKKIFYFEQLGSTSSHILELRNFYKETPIGLVAAEQTAGKGRLSNHWLSPKGNIYFSFIVPLYYIPKNLSLLSMLPAVAIINALEKLGVESFIKWPNDILIKNITNNSVKYFLNYKKIGGILVQTYNENNFINHAVIGIGININKNIYIQNSISHAGFLDELIDIDYFTILSEIIFEIDKLFYFINADYIYNSYLKKCVTINNFVMFKISNKEHIGKAVWIKKSGALLVEFENSVLEINADEVHLC